MKHIWSLDKCTVSQIIERLGDPRPPHSTISSIVRILEKKGFVTHEAYGRTYLYYPVIKKSTYLRFSVHSMIQEFFGDRPEQLVSFLVKQDEIGIKDLQQLIKEEE